MPEYTPFQARYFAEQILLKRSQSSIDGLASTMSGVRVDLNPHQVDAALFALKSPLSQGVLLADEVGLGKTIEAGLVLAQNWSERKRHILLIVPASLRTQWRTELEEKFYIKSRILESTNFNKDTKDGIINPFDAKNEVIICSFNFASRKESEIAAVPWDLVIIDEAHRLRNVYKTDSVMSIKLKRILTGKKKLLLTATPLQNNLMELYGLVSIIDDKVFGDSKTFREMYLSTANEELRNSNLKERLKRICKRTLRKQVVEYVSYTNRIPILREYMPTKDEEALYNSISEYLRSEKLYALPQGQRTLITLVLYKLLASSSFAISGTLRSLINRLEALLRNMECELDLSDYDVIDELYEEQNENGVNDCNKEDIVNTNKKSEHEAIRHELEQLYAFEKLANSITYNSKGADLLVALKQGFDKTEKLGGSRKAVIFTESRRTQGYLMNLLSFNGFDGKIVFLNGSNTDEISKRIYGEWIERHKDDGMVSGSKQVDMKAAVVEEFRNNASILIGTESAAEGINLQFCSLVVNYDLPWNPQRIEQRIGRCHRYGQKNDVVVINFVNLKNDADVRVYELLAQKFQLFDGLFGSSDEILGSIESGIDFEKRVADIYQRCKNADEIRIEFDNLQEELAEHINVKMTVARQSILENFDADVAALLKTCNDQTRVGLDKYSRWLCDFFVSWGSADVTALDATRFSYKGQVYNAKWKDAEERGEKFLRREDFEDWLMTAKAVKLNPSAIRFFYRDSGKHIGFLDSHQNLCGVLSIDKLVYKTKSKVEEHLIISVATENGIEVDEDMMDSILELPAEIDGEYSQISYDVEQKCKNGIVERLKHIDDENKQYYYEECDKLDAYSDDLKDGLEREIKELGKQIAEKRKLFRTSSGTESLPTLHAIKDEIDLLEAERKTKQQTMFKRQEEIEIENRRLQDEIRARINATHHVEHIGTISFKIV